MIKLVIFGNVNSKYENETTNSMQQVLDWWNCVDYFMS